MKKIGITLAMLFLWSSCGQKEATLDEVIASGDTSKIREKKEELILSMDAMKEQVNKLDRALSDLDTVQKLALVSALEVKESVFDHYVELQGNVSTRKNIVLNAEFSGILEQVLIKEGQEVKKGQLLAVLDDGGMQAQLAQLQAQKDLAETTFERQRRLWEQKIGSEIQYLTAKTQYESTRNAVAQMENQLAKTRITAPFSGTIDELIADPGSNLAPGMPVIRIVELDEMFVEVEVPEIYLPQIENGTRVEVYFPVLNQVVESEVRQVSNFIKPSNRTFKVEVGVPSLERRVKPNLIARVRINDYSNEKALMIPQSVITENSRGDQYVYLAGTIDGQGNTTVDQTIVKVGRTQGDMVEILEGLSPGDAIIGEGARSLLPGQQVTVIKAKEDEQD